MTLVALLIPEPWAHTRGPPDEDFERQIALSHLHAQEAQEIQEPEPVHGRGHSCIEEVCCQKGYGSVNPTRRHAIVHTVT